MSLLDQVALQPEVKAESVVAQRGLGRPCVRGKFLYIGDRKLYVRGVTYGTFRPNESGEQFPSPEIVDQDFTKMAAAGINAVRTYTTPPRWLLDRAWEHGLFVMVGLAWAQHVSFLDDPVLVREIESSVRSSARAVHGHPAVLAYAIGNEIPASIVRWHGRQRVEKFLRRLHSIVKEEHPSALVTYVNFPTTEYLDLSFLDFHSFNVYLESRDRFSSYLARLQNIAGDRPLLMAEIGLDSRVNGEELQADTLAWQIETALEAGCAGTFVFSWTDEWHRGGHDVEDWCFGVTTRVREPKASLQALKRSYSGQPVTLEDPPRISVVVCSYNGRATIGETVSELTRLQYPDFEIIVVDDGSTDDTVRIVGEFDVRLISTENHGLSHARNVGMNAATGEIVAYIDDDAYPDPHWLTYLAHAFESSSHVAIGGPNIIPPEDGEIAQCVANSPGGPCHVLLSDDLAEHIPGCNMAFRRRELRSVGGFDSQFRVAGDDVDVCWKLQERGWTLGFSAGALVWHHRRPSVRKYLEQQMGYGRAEALLERKWPERFNSLGHIPWGGRIYGQGLTRGLFPSSRVYHGVWGTALFQSAHEQAAGRLRSLSLVPEWLLLVACLGGVSLLGASWPALSWAGPAALVAFAVTVVQAVRSGLEAGFVRDQPNARERVRLAAIIGALHVAQPVVRLIGRLRHGLTPWRRQGTGGWSWPRVRATEIWREGWRPASAWLESLETALRDTSAAVVRGGDFDRWDLRVRSSILGEVKVLMAVEEHGDGRQNLRFRVSPNVPRAAALLIPLAILTGWAAIEGASVAATSIGVIGAAATAWILAHLGAAQARVETTLTELDH